MNKYYVTFGSNHYDKNNQSLGKCFVEIEAIDESEARKTIYDARYDRWAFIYKSKKAAGIYNFHLKEKTLKEVKVDL